MSICKWNLSAINPIGVPFLAYLLDRILGDPSNRWHPVAWQGRFLAWAEQRAPIVGEDHPPLHALQRANLRRFAWGAGALAVGMALSAGVAWSVAHLAQRLPWLFHLLVKAGLLKLALASRGLDRAAAEVEAALRRNDLLEARRLLSWHLVSRDTSDLSAEEVAGAAIESVAENLTDAFVAPLCAYLMGGLPGVWAYRFVQTADSMWGYHDPEHEWLGKPAARLDDTLNWLPARLAAGLLTAATWLIEGRAAAASAWHTRRSQAHNTASPNAGQTMATMAGALRVTLTKRGHYTLAGGDAAITPETLAAGRRLVRMAAGLATVGVTIAMAVKRLTHDRQR
ncbi:MAG: adenosylcobinamide-phosphate synthase CbiB [Anaerolineae bacterium]|nr:adenosylcobinamide-phosphate synthase CbiB [Anaerolineae bacterium]MDW8100915.1 adenosylcobinamide-phosphate synthase CbiB [Anaerolineae bacterium]